MGNWFDIEKIDNETYVISEYGHWEKVHSYLLIGKEKALLIDTGLGIGNIKVEVSKLTDLPVAVVTTHVHWDHIGGHRLFDNIYVHRDDANWLRSGIPMPINVIKQEVLRDPISKKIPGEFDIEDYKIYTEEPSRILEDNDLLNIGSRTIKVIHTPGHSPGHICLFEEERGYLFTGDLIYKGTLHAFYPSTDPILFKRSIDRISNLKGIARILPGHNELNIQVELVDKIRNGFKYIEERNSLWKGNGEFYFKDFDIKL